MIILLFLYIYIFILITRQCPSCVKVSLLTRERDSYIYVMHVITSLHHVCSLTRRCVWIRRLKLVRDCEGPEHCKADLTPMKGWVSLLTHSTPFLKWSLKLFWHISVILSTTSCYCNNTYEWVAQLALQIGFLTAEMKRYESR